MPYCVITADEKAPGLPVLAQVLGAAFSLDRDTAAAAARHCWGLLGSGLEAAAADDLVRRCAEFGVKALKLPDALPLPAPLSVKKVSFEAGAAVFTAAAGKTITVRREDLAVLAAAPVKEDSSKMVKTTEGPSGQEKAVRLGIMAVTGLPIGLGKSKEVNKEVKTSELSFYLDLLLNDGSARLRLNSGDLDYSGLKEKKTYSSQVNFRLLAAELASFAPAAARNAGLRAILEGAPLTLLPYDSLADLEKETLRLALARGK
ncbi:MAG: hypothetical protein A2X35_07780 [Elusimicrobia bacterium GWA2_61_42]|nr:MAG: hypothetical protein A2X35_07780 [Elusimicrobia bacterium GWA2_61_42]OGR77971.1 MAG: hypothetical protein A2X38_10810 [Elusimicrobia bacterium GWC2_61_25]